MRRCNEPYNVTPKAGGGKSWALLFEVLKYALDDPEFYGVLFRRTLKQIERTLWKEAKEMYKPFLYDADGRLKPGARVQEQKYKITP